MARSSSPSGRNVLVDCGFNLCHVVEAFAQGLPNFEIFGFEPQQDERIEARMKEVQRAHPNVKSLSHEAVYVDDCRVPFYPSGKVKERAHRTGSSVMRDKRTGAMRYDSPSDAQAIDFALCLEGHTRDADFVAVKMDIEGAEYDVLEHLLETRAIDRIDMLFVEFHWDHFEDAERMKARHDELLEKLAHARPQLFSWA